MGAAPGATRVDEEGVGATGTGMCRGAEGAELGAGLVVAGRAHWGTRPSYPGMCECAAMGAHIRRDCGAELLGRPFSKIKLASHSFLFSASLARGTAMGLLRVEARREWPEVVASAL